MLQNDKDMKKYILPIVALLGALSWTGCQRLEEGLAPDGEQGKDTVVWMMTVQASKPADAGTKALDLVEDKTLNAYWKAGEKVNVYLEGQYVGFLEVTPGAGEKPVDATLSGPLSLSSLVSEGEELALLFPRRSDYLWTYEGQNGLLTGDGSIEERFDYIKAVVTVTSKDPAHGTLTTDRAIFQNQQSIYRFGFKFGETLIPARTVILSSAVGQIATSCNVATGEAETGDLTVVRPAASTELTYVAIRNGNTTQDDTFSFTVYDGDGVTYEGSKTIPAAALSKGFVSAKNIALERLDAGLSTAETTTML
jgi:hypothetical protein